MDVANRLEFNRHLLYKKVRPLLEDYNYYSEGLLKVIGHPDFLKGDTVVKDKMSYAEWIATGHTLPVIKIEGVESVIKMHCKNIHLFVHQITGPSFDWHKDDVDVLLYVIKGKKIVYMKNRKYHLYAGDSIEIPKGVLHKVISAEHTWALSIGH